MPSLLTIILNWNCAKETVGAINSVMCSEIDGCLDIFLVDNGSKDDSVGYLQNYFKARQYKVIMVKSPKQKFEKGCRRIFFYISEKNLGFTGGNNLGFEFALTNNYDFVFLLNADARLRTRNALKILLASMMEDERIVGACPKIYFENYHGKKDVVNFSGGYIDWWRGLPATIFWEEGKEKETDVDGLNGAAMLIRTEALRTVGLFDERFFAYLEESDWCVRARRRGYRLRYVPTALCDHKVSMGVGSDFYFYSPKKIYYTFRNRLLFIQKHARPIHKLTSIPITFYSTFAQFFLRTIRIRNYKNFIENAAAIYMGLRDYIKLRG